MTRIDVVGLTLAEIALALLFCVVAVFAPSYARLEKQLRDRPDPNQLKALQNKILELQTDNDRLKRDLQAVKQGARSKQTPSCIEIGKAAGPLFTTTIRGEDRYDLDGASLTFQQIRVRFEEILSAAKSDECVQSIRVYYGPEVSVQEYDSALRRIEQLFYVTKLGQLPR
jgi:hypothetical protein